MEKELTIKNLYKTYGNLEIFRDFSIQFTQQRINCILGPSGCGKTTLLNIISGLTDAEKLEGELFNKHKISYVFQEPRLLPWKTAVENLVFTLRDTLPEERLYAKAYEYLELVELKDFAHYYPSRLSGGMKQRLSLARAFSYPSDIILMDEPFKALDIKLKKSLMEKFRRLWEKDRRTVIFVTHDVDEALSLGQKIMVFSGVPVRILNEYKNIENPSKVRGEVINILENRE